jgi:hypothetical protein
MDEIYIDDVKTKNRNWRWLEFIMACVAYVAANAVDYILTICGLMNRHMGEANPIARSYMDVLGPERGLLLFKLIMVSIVILGVFIIDLIIKEKKIKLRSEYILYAGAVITLLGSSLWLSMPYI